MAFVIFIALALLGTSVSQVLSGCPDTDDETATAVCEEGCRCTCNAEDGSFAQDLCVASCKYLLIFNQEECEFTNAKAAALDPYNYCGNASYTSSAVLSYCEQGCDCCDTEQEQEDCVEQSQKNLVAWIYNQVCSSLEGAPLGPLLGGAPPTNIIGGSGGPPNTLPNCSEGNNAGSSSCNDDGNNGNNTGIIGIIVTLLRAVLGGALPTKISDGSGGQLGGLPSIQRNCSEDDGNGDGDDGGCNGNGKGEREGEPAGGEPAGSEPAGSEPAGSEPAGSEPAGSEPAGGQPAGSEPAGSEPAGSEPAGSEPAGSEPAGSEPAGSEPAGSEPAGGQPAGGEPAGSEPAGGQPAGGQPAGGEGNVDVDNASLQATKAPPATK